MEQAERRVIYQSLRLGNMPRIANPGVPPGNEIVGLSSPFGGWVPIQMITASSLHYAASIEGVEAGLTGKAQNQYAESDGITLFHMEKFGHISPGKVWSVITDAGGVTPHINELAINGDNESVGINSWVVLRNGRLVQFTPGSTTQKKYDVVFGFPNGAGINHTGHTSIANANGDMLIMNDLQSPAKEWIIWSWEDNTDADMSIYDTGVSPYVVNSWYSDIKAAGPLVLNALLKGVPHKMCKGPDGNLYVTNGAFVEQIVINGAITSAVAGLQLPLGAGWTASGIVSYKNYVAIVASSKGSAFNRAECALFLWNGMSTTVNGVTSVSPQYNFPFPDNFANGLLYDGNNLFILSNGRNLSSKIFEFTGKGFKKIFESLFFASSGTTLQGSLENYQDSMIIGAIKNGFARICRFYMGGFHDEGTLTDGTNNATLVGVVKNFSAGFLHAGVYSLGGGYQLYHNGIGDQYQLNCALRTILYTQGILGRRMYPLGFKGTVDRIQLFLSQWGAGASLTLSLFKDYTTAGVGGANDLLNLLIDTDTTTPNSIHHKAYPSGTTEIDISDIAITDVSSFYMIITFSHASIYNTAAIIRRMLVFWSPSM